MEIVSGVPLFVGRDEHDMIRRFVALRGDIPRGMLSEGKKTGMFFDVVLAPEPSGEATVHVSDPACLRGMGSWPRPGSAQLARAAYRAKTYVCAHTHMRFPHSTHTYQ